jgi:hypothetical protein
MTAACEWADHSVIERHCALVHCSAELVVLDQSRTATPLVVAISNSCGTQVPEQS